LNNMEKLIWAASYAAEFSRVRERMDKYGRSIDDITGYSCAEVADVALLAYREAIKSDDAGYLTPVKEGDT